MLLSFDFNQLFQLIWGGVNVLLANYWELLAIIVAIPIGFMILSAIVRGIYDALEWKHANEDFLENKLVMQELLGSKTGALVAEQYRLYNDLPPNMRKFITPRDMRAGESMAEYFDTPRGISLGYKRDLPNNYETRAILKAQRIFGSAPARFSLTQKIRNLFRQSTEA